MPIKAYKTGHTMLNTQVGGARGGFSRGLYTGFMSPDRKLPRYPIASMSPTDIRSCSQFVFFIPITPGYFVPFSVNKCIEIATRCTLAMTQAETV